MTVLADTTLPAAEAVVGVVADVAQWDALRDEWEELFDASPTAAPPLRFDWMRYWWDVYGSKYADGGLRIMTVRTGGRLSAVLPLYRSSRTWASRRLAFLSSGEEEFEETCADYLDLLHRPGDGAVSVEALRRALVEQGAVVWDELVLDRISPRSPLMAWQQGMGGSLVAWQKELGRCPISDLSRGMDGYLHGLNKATRKECRRLLNEVNRAGVKVECAADVQAVRKYFEEMIELHQRRWRTSGRPGCFAAQRFTELHRRLAERWVPEGKAILMRMTIGDRVMSVVYGFATGGKFDSYLQGTALDDEGVRSAGTAALLLARRVAMEHGLRLYDDLLGSDDAYKQRFGTRREPLIRLHIVRPGLRTQMQKALDVMHRARRTGWRILTAQRRGPARFPSLPPVKAASEPADRNETEADRQA